MSTLQFLNSKQPAPILQRTGIVFLSLIAHTPNKRIPDFSVKPSQRLLFGEQVPYSSFLSHTPNERTPEFSVENSKLQVFREKVTYSSV